VDWGEIFANQVVATAILDRLLLHAHVIQIQDDSYRFKDKQRSGILGQQVAAVRMAE